VSWLTRNDKIFLGATAPKTDLEARFESLVAAAEAFDLAPGAAEDLDALDALDEFDELMGDDDEELTAEQIDAARQHLERSAAALHRAAEFAPLTDTPEEETTE
jgi:hypothetical protein